VLRMDKTNSHHLAIALAFAGGAMVYVSLVEIFPKSAAASVRSMAPESA
jgi:zinc transporter ZupT